MFSNYRASPIPPSRVVVLGASGFVGQDLVSHLMELGITTLSLSSKDLDLSAPESVSKLQQTLTKEDVLVVISAITPDKGRDVSTLMRNLSMGENLAAVLAESPCSHVIYISSDAVYEDEANPVRETSSCSPSSFHGLMHLVREKMISHVIGDVPFLILRPSLLYGPGDTHNGYGPNRFLRSAREEGKIALFGNGEEKRDHVYIKDLSRLIGLCLTRQSAGVLNVATGISVSFQDVALAVSKLNQTDVEIENRTRATPVTHRHFDTGETLRGLPSFQYLSVEEGLSKTASQMESL